MREYDETTLKVAERVIKRSDEIIRKRKIQATRRRHISYAVSGVCAAGVICFCILNISKNSKKPDTDLHGNNNTTSSESTLEYTSTATNTNTETETETVTTTTVTESSVTSETTDTATTSEAEETTDQTSESETTNHTTEPTTTAHTTEPRKSTTTTTTTTKKEVITEAATEISILQPTECGDVDGDGLVEIIDAVLIRNYLNDYKKYGKTWTEFYQNQTVVKPGFADQALANADAFRPSNKREITEDDARAIEGRAKGLYPDLPINEFIPDDD